MLPDIVLVTSSELEVESMCRTIGYWYKNLALLAIAASRLDLLALMLGFFFLSRVAGHPLAQNERCLHMFLQDEVIDKNYTPSKIRHT